MCLNVSVKDLFLKNRHVFAASVVIHGSNESEFVDDGGEDLYIIHAAYCFASLNTTDKQKEVLFGDCTRQVINCQTNIDEARYAEALSDLLYFNDLLRVQSNEIKDMINKFDDNYTLFMTICQLREKYWITFRKTCKETGKYPKDPYPDYKDCLIEFLHMPNIKQMQLYNRMEKVKEYVYNHSPID